MCRVAIESAEAHWESAALVPELQVTACYRNMDYGALQAGGVGQG